MLSGEPFLYIAIQPGCGDDNGARTTSFSRRAFASRNTRLCGRIREAKETDSTPSIGTCPQRSVIASTLSSDFRQSGITQDGKESFKLLPTLPQRAHCNEAMSPEDRISDIPLLGSSQTRSPFFNSGSAPKRFRP